jgi:hypothetical protein
MVEGEQIVVVAVQKRLVVEYQIMALELALG